MVIDHHLNPGKYTEAQLRQNEIDAYVDNYTAAANATGAVYTAAADAANYAAVIGRLIDQYFKESKENKQDYIDEINKDKK